MTLKSLPTLFQPWTDADRDKLTIDEAIYVCMLLEKKVKSIEDRVERHHHFLRHDRQKYEKIFSFNK